MEHNVWDAALCIKADIAGQPILELQNYELKIKIRIPPL